ncbi:MAG: hypothetical protein M1812_004056 [Candelaria pacifica]|nr:MAG: hypothetical protein M1812_004056 [Candelaria pacifica]
MLILWIPPSVDAQCCTKGWMGVPSIVSVEEDPGSQPSQEVGQAPWLTFGSNDYLDTPPLLPSIRSWRTPLSYRVRLELEASALVEQIRLHWPTLPSFTAAGKWYTQGNYFDINHLIKRVLPTAAFPSSRKRPFFRSVPSLQHRSGRYL